MILTKDEVVKMAREAGFIIGRSVTTGEPNSPERFATLCRAPLVAENAALKHAHEINAVMERAEAAWLADKERTLDFDIVAGRAIESALLEKLRAGVELPEADVRIYRGFATHSTKQLLAYGAAQRLAGQQRETCTWAEQDDMPGTYESSCGEMWSFIEGGLKENRVTYCHHCGGKVVPASPELSRCAAADTNHDQATKRSRLE